MKYLTFDIKYLTAIIQQFGSQYNYALRTTKYYNHVTSYCKLEKKLVGSVKTT